MDQGKDLQTSRATTLPLVQISKPADIFKARPILLQRKESGDETVLIEIRISVERCAMGLGINLSQDQIMVICNDIMEVYSYDSIEDIQQCLKKGRQGKYGFGHNKRDSLTMHLIREWMQKHLEEKAQIRENIIEHRKVETNSKPITDEKALEYIARIKEAISKGNRPKESDIKPFENTESAWQKLIDSDPLIRAFYESKKKAN